MNSQYEHLYGVGLLDDLHNYFPSLLYDSSSFSNVQDVLRYVQQQTRARFDLFSRGVRDYRSQHPAPSAAPVYQQAGRVAAGPLTSTVYSPLTSPFGSNLFRRSAPFVPQTSNAVQELFTINIPIPTDDEAGEEGTEEHDENIGRTAQALMSLLTLPTTQLRTRGGLYDSFLQPVVVRPTAEQITQNTTLGNLVSDTEYTCTVCQDVILSDQEGRKLNACGHWFHKSCIDTWFQHNVHCPVCRHDIRDPTIVRSRTTSRENISH